MAIGLIWCIQGESDPAGYTGRGPNGMGPAGRESERARPDGSTRLRLVDLATSSGTFPLGGGLACILTPTSERLAHRNARLLAAVIGPRSTDVNGTMEIAGRYVALQSLPVAAARTERGADCRSRTARGCLADRVREPARRARGRARGAALGAPSH